MLNDHTVPDAPLTALGKKQSAALAPQIPELQNSVDVIISSALKRTLQSTKLGWGPAVDRLGIGNVICLPQAQGRWAKRDACLLAEVGL